MSPPVIRAVKESIPESDTVILDAPPGTSCPVIETIRDCDYVVLVTEPTPFGLNDLELAVDMVRALNYPFGVVINRADLDYPDVWNYCQRHQIDVLAEIPDDRQVAETYSQGFLITQVLPDYLKLFKEIAYHITQKVDGIGVLAS